MDNIYMTHGAVDQCGQGSAVERCLLSAATRYPVARGRAALIARVRPVPTPSLSVPRASDPSGPAGRRLRGYGTDHAQTSAENGASSSGVCEKQWADDRCHRGTRVGRVSEYAEKAWLSRAQRAACFKFTLTTGLIACTTRSSPRPTVFLSPFGSAPSTAV